MTYASLSDLSSRVSERDLRHITDPTGQQVDTVRAQQALSDASAEIDSYVGQRYLLPLQAKRALPTDPVVSLPPHQALKRACCDVAIYRLQALRPSDDIKDARQRYEDVMKFLSLVRKGEVLIDGAALRTDVSDTPTGGESAGLPRFETPSSVWSREAR